MTKLEAIQKIYPPAKLMDISPIFTTAQACWETGWLKHTIGLSNIFGITKGDDWKGKVILVQTGEHFHSPDVKFDPPEKVLHVKPNPKGGFDYVVMREFRNYDTIAQCLQDHFLILQHNNFLPAWPVRHDPVAYVKAIQACKEPYATDPNYVKNMALMIAEVQNIVTENKL
jgi:flagellum-specific peptidoglycan hydrolase FlgJ